MTSFTKSSESLDYTGPQNDRVWCYEPDLKLKSVMDLNRNVKEKMRGKSLDNFLKSNEILVQ